MSRGIRDSPSKHLYSNPNSFSCSTGTAVVAHLAVGFTYAKLEQRIELRHEPKLSLQADLDFYSDMKLCMQLERPEQLLT